MLVADSSEDKIRINLVDPRWTKEALMELKKTTSFICPSCRTPVQLKIGETRIPHFAHINTCSIQGEKESLYHMDGKIQLHDWLQNQGIKGELETYYPSIKQRADVVAEIDDETICFEFQCAKISEQEKLARTNGYEKEQLSVKWILGGNRVKRLKTYEYRFNHFVWDFIQLNSAGISYLLSYCSKLKAFILLDSIVPFSKQTIFANTTILPSSQLSFQQFLQPTNVSWEPVVFQKQWMMKRDRFRNVPKVHVSKKEKRLQALIYEQYGIPLTLVPSEAFIPLKEAWRLKEAVYVWQTIVLHALESISEGEVFHLQRVLWLMNRNVNFEHFTQEKDIVQTVVQSYLNKLSTLGIIHKVKRNEYKKSNYSFFLSSYEAIQKRDKQMDTFFRQKRKV
ncbi:competence protein CoiA [Bacillus kexueae]|uniref:competence protein CoiA n=1 Tax=Aeribacillus kexueae TaxID=2078952 RepID=UPI001FAE8283|nr:competence protein CoiA family protein [Bacillus kexueae]